MLDQFKQQLQFCVVRVQAARGEQFSGDGTERRPQGLPARSREEPVESGGPASLVGCLIVRHAPLGQFR